jgi:hypothetical protein
MATRPTKSSFFFVKPKALEVPRYSCAYKAGFSALMQANTLCTALLKNLSECQSTPIETPKHHKVDEKHRAGKG